MKHTTGNWTLKWNRSSVSITANDGHGSIAIIKPRYTKTNNLEEQDANAKLIAAAPELLKACKASLFGLELRLKRESNHEGLKQDIKQIKEAIKKATQ